LLVLAVAAVIVALALHQSTQSDVHYEKVIAHDWSTAVNKVQSIISHYTK
jgi:hypothetical protein